MMAEAFMCGAGEVKKRLKDKLSREGRSGSVLRTSLRDVIIVAAREERQPCSGRFGRLAAVADQQSQPMRQFSKRSLTFGKDDRTALSSYLNRPFHAGGAKRVAVFYTPHRQGLCRRTHRAGATCQNRNLYSVPPQKRVYTGSQPEERK